MTCVAVLNPGGTDREQHFAEHAGLPDPNAHPPVNYHAFAACTGGGFFRDDRKIPRDHEFVILLLKKNLGAVQQALLELRRAGKTVAIAMKEAGAFQVAELLGNASRLRRFKEICRRAHGAIATTPDLVTLFRGAGIAAVEFIAPPYPVEDERWNFSRPAGERRGIFLGTREFNVFSRNHLAALLTVRMLAAPMQEPVTVINEDGWRGRRILAGLGWPDGLLRAIEGREPYPRYLERMARHKLVFQLDAGGVPGQVAGDALLCRIPCIGGTGATERLIYPELCGFGRNTDQLFDIAARLLEHLDESERIVHQAVAFARERLSFSVVARQVTGFFAQLRK
jgi:hypothetical protein